MYFDNKEDWFIHLKNAKELGEPPGTPTVVYKEPGADGLSAAFGETRAFFANEALKDILEALEPGIHDFAPMQLRYGVRLFPYYVFRPRQFLKAIDTQASDVRWCRTAGCWRKPVDKPMVIKPDVARHFWHEAQSTFVSDVVHDEIRRRGLITGWEFQKQLVLMA